VAAKEAVASAGLTRSEVSDSAFISSTSTEEYVNWKKYFFDLQGEEINGPWQEFRDTACPGEHAERIADFLGIKNTSVRLVPRVVRPPTQSSWEHG